MGIYDEARAEAERRQRELQRKSQERIAGFNRALRENRLDTSDIAVVDQLGTKRQEQAIYTKDATSELDILLAEAQRKK